MKIKICGVCRPEDAEYAARAGADYVGVILARKGPRTQSLETAGKILHQAVGKARVGVFADQPIREIVEACERLKLDVVQLHGNESIALVAEVQRSISCLVWKAVSLETPADLKRAGEQYGDFVDGMLFDGPRAGTGSGFDWNLAGNARDVLPPGVQVIIAGGLTPENVGEAVMELQPNVVDVASGVEVKACEKSKERIDRFIRNALR